MGNMTFEDCANEAANIDELDLPPKISDIIWNLAMRCHELEARVNGCWAFANTPPPLDLPPGAWPKSPAPDPLDQVLRLAGAEILLSEAVQYEQKAFELNEPVSGADLVDWFGEWRQRVKEFLRAHKRADDDWESRFNKSETP